MIKDEVIDEIFRLRDEGLSQGAIAQALKISQSTVCMHLKARGPTELVRQTVGPRGTTSHFTVPRGEPFELLENERLIGRSVLEDEAGTIVRWNKTKVDQHEADLRNALKEVFKEIQGVATVAVPDHPDIQHGDLLQVYPLADQHVGLLAWGVETGEDYDLKIGERRLRDVSERLVASAPAARHALILGLGDYFHVDDEGKATPASKNRLDGDGRHYKILKTGVRMLKDLVQLALTRHAHVTVVNLPGNHDPHAKMVLDVGLSEAYLDHPRVTIVEQPGRWFFKSFGVNLIGATHGDEAKPDAMVLRMAEHPEWSSCASRVFYYGHFHRDQSRTIGSCRTICVPTIVAHDAWGAGKGFTARKAMIGTTYHLHEGEIMSQRVNL